MNKKILIFVACDYEDMELQYPKFRMLEAGANVQIAGEKKDEVYKGKNGYPCKADLAFDSVKVSDFDALIIPGGHAPDKLRTIPKVLEITRQFHEAKKLIAFICHAGWVPISAKVIKGVKSTSYDAIKDDMVNAGANWVDEAVVVDGHFISSRCPDDLPKFGAAIIQWLEKSK
ncbi:MAG: type 1 glutamine amidotransferase domain-containing protein [Chlamydiales bacterium]|nr:type 1 glutamine amidotransferase domain-containing protein [Chlamydiales bacterium]